MQYDLSQNHFFIFGLLPRFYIDTAVLDQSYRDIQRHVHPDRYAHAADAERRISMQMSAHANQAYRTLKKPDSRARYLLQLRGVDALEESNTSMSSQFLMQQMDSREAIADAASSRNEAALQKLEQELKKEVEILLNLLGMQLDHDRDDGAAAESVRKLKFMEKLLVEIQDNYEVLEA
jgi:molecular chaperone HscB